MNAIAVRSVHAAYTRSMAGCSCRWHGEALRMKSATSRRVPHRRPELEATVQARLDSMAGRRVGYLKLKSFTARTQPDVAAAVRHLQVCRRTLP